jgi:gamma-glutamylcyclotransferase (GGCT)/AIG2-like uncharacterized protein YtfP
MIFDEKLAEYKTYRRKASHQRPLPVLVYGTLRAKYGNNRLLRTVNAVKTGEGWLKGFTLHGRGIPFAIPVEVGKIWVERWEIPAEDWESGLNKLDQLEGEGRLYYRIEVEFEGNPCWMYMGDWNFLRYDTGVQARTFSRYEEMVGY